MKTNLASFFFLLGFLFLNGCAREAGEAPPSFGNAVRQNIAVQIVNPDAAESGHMPAYSGERAALAQKRYVTDTTEKAQAPKTSSGGSGGGK